jgi:hypothetical protein
MFVYIIWKSLNGYSDYGYHTLWLFKLWTSHFMAIQTMDITLYGYSNNGYHTLWLFKLWISHTLWLFKLWISHSISYITLFFSLNRFSFILTKPDNLSCRMNCVSWTSKITCRGLPPGNWFYNRNCYAQYSYVWRLFNDPTQRVLRALSHAIQRKALSWLCQSITSDKNAWSPTSNLLYYSMMWHVQEQIRFYTWTVWNRDEVYIYFIHNFFIILFYKFYRIRVTYRIFWGVMRP